VLRSIADALNVSLDTLLVKVGFAHRDAEPHGEPYDETKTAIRRDPRLTDDQKRALLVVYRSYTEETAAPTG